MRFYLLALAPSLTLASLVFAEEGGPAKTATDRERLQGTWRTTSAELNGKPLLEDGDTRRVGKAKDAKKPDKPSGTLKPSLKSTQRSSGPGGRLFVFAGDGGGPIHRAGPEHFKLTRISDGRAVSLLVGYDRETLDEQARLGSEGTPRNLRQRVPAVKSQYVYNHLFHRVRLFLDTGSRDDKQDERESDALDLYARARLEPGERYRLTWACWPVGAVKATEVSVDFQLSEKEPPAKGRIKSASRAASR